MNKAICSSCGKDVRRSRIHDAIYCPACLEWLEPKCKDESCEFCRNRPEKPPEMDHGRDDI